MIDSYIRSLIAFSITDFIGFNRFIKIKKQFPTLHEFLNLSINDQLNFLDLKNERAVYVFSKLSEHTDKVVALCEKKSINFIPHNHPSYPPQLKKIPDPPYLLYSLGDFQTQIPLIGVIGTRKITKDAEQNNRWFSEEFIKNGYGIVSGLAAGHDAIACDTALQYKGYSVAVLGTAIDTIYPTSSAYLYKKLIENGGAILSEYPPGMTGTKWRFPRRNRIVSALSEAILVVQAPEKSGTLITVSLAQSHQKDVYVIPGNPMQKQNHGSNMLIQNGAKMALHPQDIINELNRSFPNMITPSLFSSQSPEPYLEPVSKPILKGEEAQIYDFLDSSKHIDEIARELNINISILNSILTLMELRGIIIQKPGQLYLRS